jgi:hypothetical protein
LPASGIRVKLILLRSLIVIRSGVIEH